MSASIRSIAAIMDPADPPRSLRQLARRHRWEDGVLPESLTLRTVLARHGSLTKHHRFLWYNTFLLQGFELSICNLIILGRLLDKLGLAPRDVLELAGFSPKQVAEALGLSKRALVDGLGYGLDALKSAFAGVVDGLVSAITLGMVDIGIDDILDEVSLQDIVNKFDLTVEDILAHWEPDPLIILAKFCKQTLGFLSSHTGIPLDVAIHIKGKPERSERANEIGAAIALDYDIVALCEVFEESSIKTITQVAGNHRPNVLARTGPTDEGELASSGLLTLALERAIVGEKKELVFQHKGEPIRDADAWANKGVLKTVIDLGPGKIEVYSTHFMAGGGIDLDEIVFAGVPNYDKARSKDVFETQIKQIDELVAFIKQTHDPRNIAIVVGDFNLSAQVESEYEALVNRMHQAHLYDAWPFHRYRQEPSIADTEKDLEGNDLPRGDSHGSKDGNMSSAVEKVCSPSNGKYCDDTLKPSEPSGRIDYLFMEIPRPEHTFTIDLTRIRRRPFHRPNASADQEKFLSDHLGLDCTLIANPKQP